MKLLLAHEFYRSSAPSGEDAVFMNERAMLEKSGIEVVTHEIHNDDIDDSSLAKRIGLGINTIWSRKSYKSFIQLIDTHKPDIVHVHNTFPLFSPSIYKACRDKNVPVVQTLHNFRLICPGALLQRNNSPCEDCIGGSLLSSIRHACYRDSVLATLPLTGMIAYNRFNNNYNQVDQYIALTEFAASRLIAAGLPKDRVTVKPNFLPSPPKPGASKSEYAVYVGRISDEKGVRTMINAWSELKHIPLQVLGDGPLRVELEQYCKSKDLPVTFHGPVSRDSVIDIVSNAAFQIIPSEWYEGFPMVVLEAFATSTPVLASKIGSLNEIIVEGENGLKFEAGNSSDLAEKAKQLWQSPDLLKKMGVSARKNFDEKYTEEKNIHYLKNIYNKLIK